MAWLTITTDATPDFYVQTTQLEGIEYAFTFRWSDRESAWYLQIGDQDGNALTGDIKLVANWPLMLRFSTYTDVPPGRLILIDTTGLAQDMVKRSDLNTTHILTYITSDDPDVASIDEIASP